MKPFELAVEKSRKKVEILKNNPLEYLTQAILAGLYLTCIGLVYWYTYDLLKENIGIAKIIASLTFGLGLTTIIFLKGELFTSNNMYLVMSSIERKTSWFDTFKIWTISWFGNLLGAFIMVVLVYFSGFFENISEDFIMYKFAVSKVEYSIIKMIFKGILANWVVCLAVWCYLNFKNEMAQIFMIILIIFTFLLLGFEHSIANMGTFLYTIFTSSEITLLQSFNNLLWVTIGNIIGGGLFIGGVYTYLKKQY